MVADLLRSRQDFQRPPFSSVSSSVVLKTQDKAATAPVSNKTNTDYTSVVSLMRVFDCVYVGKHLTVVKA